MANKETVSIEEAAKMLGLSPQGLREHIKRGVLDVGIVIPCANGSKDSVRYLVFREKLERLVGKHD